MFEGRQRCSIRSVTVRLGYPCLFFLFFLFFFFVKLVVLELPGNFCMAQRRGREFWSSF